MKFVAFLLFFLFFTVVAYPETPVSLSREQAALAPFFALKQKQPNWRPDIVRIHPKGAPALILYYEPLLEGGERVVKQILFYETGRVQSEADLVAVEADSPASQAWGSALVPHGSYAEFNAEGKVSRVAEYHLGLLEGIDSTFYPSGKLRTCNHYKEGLLEGPAQTFSEKGDLKEEALYHAGRLHGDFIQYYENGTKALHYVYQDGKSHGTATEWYPSGVLR